MRFIRLLSGILLFGLLSAYQTGGFDVFAADGLSGIWLGRSNTVDVKTLIIDVVTTNRTVLLPGQSMQVTLSVRNTSTQNINLERAELRFFLQPFSAAAPLAANPASFTVLPQNYASLVIPAASTRNFIFNVTAAAGANYAKTSQLVIDGFLLYDTAYSDTHWHSPNILSDVYQYAARIPASIDASGRPEVVSVNIAPSPAKAGDTVTVTIFFSRAMDDQNGSVKPRVYFRLNGGAVEQDLLGNTTTSWAADKKSWTGAWPVILGQNGTAVLGIDSIQDILGIALEPSNNIGSFVLDTLKPVLNVYPHFLTGNVGVNLPVTLRADEALRVTPQVELVISGNIFSGVTVVSTEGNITFNGFVYIPPSALPAIGTIATFNLKAEYTDLAGNTNNVLHGNLHIYIDKARPVIVSVNFDDVPAHDNMPIAQEPLIKLLVLDYKNAGIEASSLRVSVDGQLVFSGPAPGGKNSDAPYWTYLYEWRLNTLQAGERIFSFGISDTEGVPAEPYEVKLKVILRNSGLLRPPVPAPNPFSPDADGVDDTTTIVYQLARAEDLNIYIYDINGNVVWRRFIPSGQEGARAGINRVVWDGQASFRGGGALPNGIYICHILADTRAGKKSLGRAKILILK
jgi:hypothetical protein